ncbi:hypothetical protein E3P99_03314 [Wallemia hederae]|uniref:Uncharacterized protein n=1 Tax=Wallemia hederae TaxID=1540922 RepID=A0A4T0FH09_9BASI|nr:hypothetical protein E3P99_03314 [Wallemia hederae]
MCKHNYNHPDPEYRRRQAEVFKQNTDLFFGVIGSKDLPDEPKRTYKGYKLLKGDDYEEGEPLLNTSHKSSGSSSSYSHHAHSTSASAHQRK